MIGSGTHEDCCRATRRGRAPEFARAITDTRVLETAQELIDDLECRARRLDEAG
jgi:hypothetical protein